MKKRSEKRIKKKLLVHVGENGFEQMGITANISASGMCIATTEIFPLQSEILIWIAAADDIFALKGLVIWSRNREVRAFEGIPAGVGIKIKESVPGYAQFIETLKKNRPTSLNTQTVSKT